MTDQSVRRVAIVGGVRTPFCRSNSLYADLTNLDMLSTALQGLADRFGLAGEEVGELYAGAVTTHAKDWNLAKEAALSTSLSPMTPAITMMQACGTSLQAAMILAGKIAAGHIDSGIAAGTDSTSDAPIVFKRRFAQKLIKLGQARTMGQRVKGVLGIRPSDFAPQVPSPAEPRTGLSMGQHCELMAKEWGITREEQDQLAMESHHKAAAAYKTGQFDKLITPCAGVWQDNNLRPDTSREKMAKLRNAFDKSDKGSLTAANSTPLTDGASAVLLASEEWAKEHKLPVQAYLTFSQTAAVDYVGGEGLLMAPTVAMSRMLQRAGRSLQDFDIYEIHEAFAAQVLCTLKAWEDEDYCKNRLGLDAPLGAIDKSKLNPRGSSLAVGHPFAATGGRILADLADQLEQRGSGSGVISICTAGGMGVTAILER